MSFFGNCRLLNENMAEGVDTKETEIMEVKWWQCGRFSLSNQGAIEAQAQYKTEEIKEVEEAEVIELTNEKPEPPVAPEPTEEEPVKNGLNGAGIEKAVTVYKHTKVAELPSPKAIEGGRRLARITTAVKNKEKKPKKGKSNKSGANSKKMENKKKVEGVAEETTTEQTKNEIPLVRRPSNQVACEPQPQPQPLPLPEIPTKVEVMNFKNSCDEGEAYTEISKAERKMKMIILILLVALAAVVVLAIIGITLAAVLSKGKTVEPDKIVTDAYTVVFTTSGTYNSSLADSNSVEFHSLSKSTCQQIDEIYQQDTDLSASYTGCSINSFSAGSVITNSTLLFDAPAQQSTNQISETEGLVRNALENGGANKIPNFVADSTAVVRTGEVSQLASSDVDSCLSSPCQHNGTCTDGVNTFFCACIAAYTGNTCATDVAECASSSCSGHGSCIEKVGGGIACLCTDGYSANDCSTDINDCLEMPCLHGNCTDLVNDFFCTCDATYTGKRCDVDITECDTLSCSGNGECVEVVGGGTACSCVPGYTSANCSTEVNDCLPNPCSYGNCTDVGSSFNCTCETGYSGERCDVDIVECAVSTCNGHGSCIEIVGGGTACVCDMYYSSEDCSIEHDACADSPCIHGNCTNLVSDFNCICESGYDGGKCETDIVECAVSTCNGHGSCIEIVGGGTACVCDMYYSSEDCSIEHDACADSPCIRGNCTNLVSDFNCTCEAGYDGERCDNDIDECSLTSNPCSGNGECYDQVNGYLCLCTDGYTGAECQTNINDCLPNPCIHGNCTDDINSYNCTCDSGYEGETCAVDIDECSLTSNPCSGNGECYDQVNGYLCLCTDGFTGAECQTNIDDCLPNPCIHGNCTDDINSYNCTCESGYEGETCAVDIDECSLTSNPCSGNGECYDQVNGYLCLCTDGFTGAECQTNIDDCVPNPCIHGNCTDDINSYNCTCDSGYEGETCAMDIVECDNSTCNGHGECMEIIGGGTFCVCDVTYSGSNCSTDIDECAEETLNDCDGNATCTNLDGGYVCTCKGGYTGNGSYCEALTCKTFDIATANNSLAVGMTVNMSSVFAGTPGTYLVDGLYEMANVAGTDEEQSPWMQIDLGEIRCIAAVRTYHNVGSRGTFENVLVNIGVTVDEVATNSTNTSATCAYSAAEPDLTAILNCTSRIEGRYVRISALDVNNYFDLYELDVIGWW